MVQLFLPQVVVRAQFGTSIPALGPAWVAASVSTVWHEYVCLGPGFSSGVGAVWCKYSWLGLGARSGVHAVWREYSSLGLSEVVASTQYGTSFPALGLT